MRRIHLSSMVFVSVPLKWNDGGLMGTFTRCTTRLRDIYYSRIVIMRHYSTLYK